jgi:23S rRNA pseudouridine2605 synthase
VRGKQRFAKNAGPGRGHIGLGRALSKLGFCSRSQAFEMIRAGRVRLNGAVSKNPDAGVRPGKDRIEVDGVEVRRAERIYWMLNKPRGLVTTAEDEQGRETVYVGLPAGLPWMAAVGRLDKASEGLLFFTNNSEWAARVTAPESHLDKIYHVQIATAAGESLLSTLMSGVRCGDGELLRAKRATRLRTGEKNSWIEIVLDEGKNRQIRRMLEACGVEVLRLVRVAIGPVQLGQLEKGTARELTAKEKEQLDRAVSDSAIKGFTVVQQIRVVRTGKSQ